jgi:hypothetical protein
LHFMRDGHFKAITGVAVLLIVIAASGAPLHSPPAEFQHLLKAPAVITTPWLPCDAAQSALLSPATVVTPPGSFLGTVTELPVPAPVHPEDFPHYIRLPPAV